MTVDVKINLPLSSAAGFIYFFRKLLAGLLPGKYINRGEKRDKVQTKKAYNYTKGPNEDFRASAADLWILGFRVWGGAPGYGHACFSLELWIFQLEGSKLFEGASEQSAPNL